MTPKPQFALTENERASPLWQKLTAHLESKLTKLRLKNDTDADERATALTRGEIRAYVAMLKLGNERPEPTQD